MDADRMMRNMMQSMGMGMPFGGMLDDFFGPPSGPSQQRHPDPMTSMLPHGFMSPMPMMMNPFQNIQQAMSMANNGNGGFSYCSSSVTSYTTDEHGRPQVYQQSNEVKQGPSGLKETKSSIRDTRTGHQELAIGHHLHDKAHVKKKSKNVYTGEEEQVEDLVNLNEDEAESFEQNWMRQAQSFSNDSHNQLQYGACSRPARNARLALTDGSHDKSAMKTKKKKKSKEEKYK